MNVDFVLGNPPACYAEFLRNEYGGVGFFQGEEFNFVELEGQFVVGAGEGAVVAAHVETHGSFATGLYPDKNAVELGKVLAAGLAVAQENLDAHIGVGVAFLKFVVYDDGGIGTGEFNRRSATICRVRFCNEVRIIVQVQWLNNVQSILMRKKCYDRNCQKHKNQNIHPEQNVYLLKYPRHRCNLPKSSI